LQTTNPNSQRRNNLAVLARAIWKKPGISRRELVERFDIDESSVSRLVALLLEMGLVESSGVIEGNVTTGISTGGRRRIALKIAASYGQVWGLTLWRDQVRVTLVDIQGEPLKTAEYHLGPYAGNWIDYFQRALGLAVNLAAEVCPQLPLLGIGFAVPGWVDSETATIRYSDEFGLVEQVCPQFWNSDFPVLWENDANCGAWCGLDKQESSADEIFVLGRFLEQGPMGLPSELSIGFGLIIDGKVFRGWRHKAGEFLSALWNPGHINPFGVPDETFGRSRTDSEAFLSTVTDLVRNLRFATQFLDPRQIHLGGDLKHRHQDVLTACSNLGWAQAFKLLKAGSPHVDEVSLGAARLVLDGLFQSPSAKRFSLFNGYATGRHDPLWRGTRLENLNPPVPQDMP